MPRIPQYDTRTDPEDYYMPQNFDPNDPSLDEPNTVKTRKGKYASGKTLPGRDQTKQPSPTEGDVNTGQGTDADISTGIEQMWLSQMLRHMLGSGMVPQSMVPNTVGPGVPSNAPGQAMEGDPNQVGSLFDPTPMARQRRGFQ